MDYCCHLRGGKGTNMHADANSGGLDDCIGQLVTEAVMLLNTSKYFFSRGISSIQVHLEHSRLASNIHQLCQPCHTQLP